MKYKKAPVSEVIIGVTFDEAVISVDRLFQAQQTLKLQFPITEIRPPITDESMIDFRLTSELNPEKSGPFLIRMRSEKKKWLCQIQRNKIYLNWIRSDVEDVGYYVGFTKIRQKFNELLSTLELNLEQYKVKYFDLTYHDRLEWQDYVRSISNLKTIMTFSAPHIETPQGFNNVFSKYTYRFPDLGGYGILSINTDTSAKATQVLKFENIMRGFVADMAFDVWIGNARDTQFRYFEQMFTKKTLAKWK